MQHTEREITKRFFECVQEVVKAGKPDTLTSVAARIGTSLSYLSQLKKRENPKLSVSLIAVFCELYAFNPAYILLGKGDRKAPLHSRTLQYNGVVRSIPVTRRPVLTNG